MESTAPWAKNWSAEVAPAADDAQVWAPAVGHPSPYASVADIFGSSSCCNLQPYVVRASSYSSEGQLVEYNYYNNYAAAAPAQHTSRETSMNSAEKLFLERNKEFKDDAKLMKKKMHRYPPSIKALEGWCTVPKLVAIGPYYNNRENLGKTEKMKHVAAHYCIQKYNSVNNNNPGLPVQDILQDMYDAVVSVTAEIDARDLYDNDVMEGIGYEHDFLPMMFYDACFLVMYILFKSKRLVDGDLFDFFKSKDNDIAHDIMLLENQIPLQVVHAVMNKCTSEPLQEIRMFIDTWREDGFTQDRAASGLPPVDWDQDYYDNEAPHLLGLLRFYAVGKRSRQSMVSLSDLENMESLSYSVGAVELAEMGIILAANKKTELPDIGLSRKWIIFAELCMAPLYLNYEWVTWLVNMAALELCTTPNFMDADRTEFEDSAVCSYLQLLSMLIHRIEDVHELRTRGVLQGSGLTNQKTLDFFSSLQSLRRGRCYDLVMVELQIYRNKRPWIKAYAFLYNNWKYIVAVSSAFGGFIGIITTLMELYKGAH